MNNRTYVVEFPKHHPLRSKPLRLRSTGEMVPYLKLPFGAEFLMNGEVYEKLDNQNSGRMLPWDDEGYTEMDSNGLLGVTVERLVRET